MRSSRVDDIRACLSFYSRLPVRAADADHPMPDFAGASWAAPVAGAIIGAAASALVIVLTFLGLPSLIVAVLAVGALVLTTGALHEDGLADVMDGFGGGATRERKLEIMRDSRLGTYGVLGLLLSTLLRVAAIFTLLSQGALFTAACLVGVSSLSRGVGLLPLSMLGPARGDGAGASAAAPSSATLRRALVIGIVTALAPVLAGAAPAKAVVAVLVAFSGAIGVTRLAGRQIGGYTGDVLGAAQQVAEIGMLIALSA
jgi:adenosylcobinamide-GDP ribazoletransferase